MASDRPPSPKKIIFGCSCLYHCKMNHFVHYCSFSTSNKITSKGCQSASQTCDFDAKMQNFSGDPSSSGEGASPSGEGDTPSPHLTALGASILTPPILNSCLCYWYHCTLFYALSVLSNGNQSQRAGTTTEPTATDDEVCKVTVDSFEHIVLVRPERWNNHSECNPTCLTGQYHHSNASHLSK